jgi:hypothetical protein
MSRVIHIDASVEDVTASCQTHSAGISTIEPLISGGTRVVLLNGDAAAIIRRAYKGRLLSGQVERVPIRMRN